MKQLMRRFTRVSDSSTNCLLISNPTRTHRTESFRQASGKLRRYFGGVPVYVGEEMEKFVISAEFLNHPIFIRLLNRSAQEYGYEQRGVLRIPCHVLVFERILDAVQFGDDGDDVEDLIDSLSDEFC